MKILLIHPFFLPSKEAGGARWNEISRLWGEQGHQLTILAGTLHYGKGRTYEHCRGKWIFEEKQSPNLHVFWTHVSEKYNSCWMGRLWAYLTFLASASWAGFFRVTEPVDIVIATSPPLSVGLLGVLLARWKRVPLVTEIRDLWPDVPIQLGLLRHSVLIWAAYWFERWLYQNSARIVVLTPAFRWELISRKGVPERKLAVVPNAADLELTDALANNFDRQAFRRQHGMEGFLWIIYAGALGVANGLERVLQAAVLLRDEPVRFLFLGDGSAKRQLVQQAMHLQLEHVRFLDSLPRQEALQYLLASDIGLVMMQPKSIFETMYSNKTFDYLATRRPVLMALDGLSRTLIERAGAGCYVNPDRPDELAKTVCRYIRYPQVREEQGQKGYDYVKQHFDRKVIAQEYLNLIRHVSEWR